VRRTPCKRGSRADGITSTSYAIPAPSHDAELIREIGASANASKAPWQIAAGSARQSRKPPTQPPPTPRRASRSHTPARPVSVTSPPGPPLTYLREPQANDADQ